MKSWFRSVHRQAPQQARCRSLTTRVHNTAQTCIVDPRSHKVNVSFKVKYACNFGQTVAVVGNSPELGHWSARHAVRMQWSHGDTWNCSVTLPAGASVECKYVVLDGNGREVRWQEGTNMAVQVPATFQGLPVQRYDVNVSWCQTLATFSALPSAPSPVAPSDAVERTSAARTAAFGAAATAAAASPAAVSAAPVMAWAIAKGSSSAASTSYVAAPLAKAAPAEALAAASVAHPASQQRPAVSAAPSASASAAPISMSATLRAAASAAQAPTAPAAAAAPTAAAAPPVVARPSLLVKPASSDEPMSIVLPPRSSSPPLKISLSSSFSQLMDLPNSPRASMPGTAAGAAPSKNSTNGSGAGAASWSSVSGKAPAPAVHSHPIDAAPAPNSNISSAVRARGAGGSASSGGAGSPAVAAPSSKASRSAAQPPPIPSPDAATWGHEHDIYSAACDTPYMHSVFDLEAYAMYEQTCPEPVRASPPRSGPVGLGGLLNHDADFLESAVQAARGSPSASASATLSPEPFTAAAASAAPAPSPPAAPLPPASEPPSCDPCHQASRASPSVSDWASRTLFQLSSDRSLVEDGEDSHDDDTADEEAALVHAMAAPVSPADMAALLTQLGTTLGRSVRLRYEGMDVGAGDLLELDRKIALATSKLYRQRDGLLAGWVRKETRRELAAAASAVRPPGSRSSVTPM